MSFNDVLNSNIEIKIITPDAKPDAKPDTKPDAKPDTKPDKSKKDKSTIIQIKIPTSVNSLLINKKSEPEKTEDKVNIVIKSC